jgi:SAM-dependent methyltransferase
VNDEHGATAAGRHRREELRRTFGADAERYDRMRPGYPAELFDDLAGLACIGSGCRVLEIGPGTGQATRALAERGCHITAVELSPQLARVARGRLNGFPNVRIEVGTFEDWPLPPNPYDTVVAATAFHWLDPAVRVEKAARALLAGGALATIATHHVEGGTTAFFAEVQACYERWDPAMTPPGLRLPGASEIEVSSEELDRSGLYDAATFRRYEWEIEYSTAEYRELLLTYSGHIAMDRDSRRGLLACIEGLIESRYGGRIAKRYLTELCVARRRSSV